MIDPNYLMRGIPVSRRFWSFVAQRGEDDCWFWTGKRDGQRRYGRFNCDGKTYGAHVLAFFFHYNEWPTHCVCHTCDHPLCCNPRHLFHGTHIDNAQDMLNKGRQASALTDEDIKEIRRLHSFDITYEEIAKQYPVSAKHIGNICTGKHWSHL